MQGNGLHTFIATGTNGPNVYIIWIAIELSLDPFLNALETLSNGLGRAISHVIPIELMGHHVNENWSIYSQL